MEGAGGITVKVKPWKLVRKSLKMNVSIRFKKFSSDFLAEIAFHF